jgi:hypothetical protein
LKRLKAFLGREKRGGNFLFPHVGIRWPSRVD